MPTENQDFDAALSSRTGFANPLGKLDEQLKTHVDEETATRFLRKAAAQNKVPGVLLRDLVYLYVHGSTFAELVAKCDRESLCEEGLNEVFKRFQA